MLLVNIEMPKTCGECPMLYEYKGDYEYTCDSNGCKILKMRFNEYRWAGEGERLVDIKKERYNGCPLKEIILCKDCIKHNDDHSFCDDHCMKDDEFCSRALSRKEILGR